MKASYHIVNACDKLIVAEETEGSNKLLIMLLDSVALLELSRIELNALRRDLIKHKLPDHLKQLTIDVPSHSTHLFVDDIQKRTNQIAATNTALRKSSTYYCSSQRQFSRQSKGYQIRSNRNLTKNYYAPSPSQNSSAQGKKVRLQAEHIQREEKLNVSNAFKSGNIKNYFSQWSSITSYRFFTESVKWGLNIDFLSKPVKNTFLKWLINQSKVKSFQEIKNY